MSFGKRPSTFKPDRENRRAVRTKVYRKAQIVHDDGRQTACWLIDVSASGALLGVASVLGIPNAFELLIDTGDTYRVIVMRRSAGKLGVRFTER